jgi:outer membrane protein OmpA-like peptidoglycan-associated protein
MLGAPIILKRGAKDEAEKPFWISYADLMTALMVLFLVVMSVALLAVTKTVSDIERQKAEREQDITKLLDEVEKAAAWYQGIKVDKEQKVIDFGDKAHFEKGKHSLTPDQARLLRAFVPEVLTIARSALGRKWLKRIVVEGFASPEGDYLYNLNLSLQRSQRVLCVLLAQPFAGERAMTEAELEQIRDLFLVGGYSFNSAKYNAVTASYDESRRIELRLEFLGIGEPRPATGTVTSGNFGRCALGG